MKSQDRIVIDILGKLMKIDSMWFWRVPHNPSAYDDDFEGQPTQGWWHKWMLGIIAALAMIGWGLFALSTQHAILFSRNLQRETFHGPNALALGCAGASLGLFLHFHYFWGNIYDQAWFAVLGKVATLIGLIASLAFVIVRVGVLGHN